MSDTDPKSVGERAGIPDDRRLDDETRERLVEIEKGYAKQRDRVDKAIRGTMAGMVVLILAVLAGFIGVKVTLDKIKTEGNQRRDQSCLLFEGETKKTVRQLAATYDYLEKLTPQQRTEGINPAVIAQLPQTEDDARTSTAPAYCDKPGVGLPEPNPTIPRRPPGLTTPPPKGAHRWAGHD